MSPHYYKPHGDTPSYCLGCDREAGSGHTHGCVVALRTGEATFPAGTAPGGTLGPRGYLDRIPAWEWWLWATFLGLVILAIIGRLA